jgi:hypothetical protein
LLNHHTLSIGVVTVMIVSMIVSNAFAGGPRYDSDDRYDHIPGAGDCWVNSFDGQNDPFSQSRNEE